MRDKGVLAVASAVLLISLLLPINIVSGAYSGTQVLDIENDVTLHEFRERRVSGHSAIDIVSLETFERVGRVEAYLTLDGDVKDIFGFIYSMSVGGVSVVYDNGTFQIFRNSDGEDLSDDVDVQVTQRQITAEVPKSRMEGEFIINATAQEYILDYGQDLSFENYFDSVEGGDPSPISQYQITADDPVGDVKFSYIEETGGVAPHLDIRSISIESSSSGTDLTLRLGGAGTEPLADNDAEYRIFLGEEGYLIAGGEAAPLQSDGRPVRGLSFDEERFTLTLGGAPPRPGETVRAFSREDLPGGGWMEDPCPDVPYKQLDIFPFGTGETLEMILEIGTDNEGTLTMISKGYDPSLISSLDEDGSGDIEEDEKTAVLSPMTEAMEDHYPVSVDGNEPDHTGVEAGLSSSFELTITTTFTIDNMEEASISLSSFRSNPPLEGEVLLETSLRIVVPDGFRILPLTVRPEELGNHLTLDSATIEMRSEDPADLDMIANGITFAIREERKEPPQDNGVEYEDVPAWIYVTGAIILIAAALLILRSGRRKVPPGDDL